MEICLDTDIVVDILRRREDVIEELKKISFTPAITAITVTELFMGERRGENLELLLREMKFYPLDFEAAVIAGKIYKELKKKGKLIDFRDLLIGAICIKFNLPLMTRNTRHFKRLTMYGLKLFNIHY